MKLSRVNKASVQVAADRRLSFYAALYGVPTLITTDFGTKPYTEVILDGCFDEYLKGAGEVIGNVNHLDRLEFARRSTGSLLLQSDAKGLFASAYLPTDAVGDMVMKANDEGRITGASFEYVPILSRTREDGAVERQKVMLLDVCVTIDAEPCYPETKNEVLIRSKKDRSYLLSLYRLQKWKLGV